MEARQVHETPRHSVSVAAAIFDDSGERVLLIKRRDNGSWEPPGGVLELGETVKDGLRRELREETGAEIEVGPLTGVYKNMASGIVALVFRARALTTPDLTSGEAAAIRWIPISDLDDLVATVYAVRLRDAISGSSDSVSVRAHDGFTIVEDASTASG